MILLGILFIKSRFIIIIRKIKECRSTDGHMLRYYLKWFFFAPFAKLIQAKAGPGLLNWMVWIQFPPSPTHKTSLLCSAMSCLMKLVCL